MGPSHPVRHKANLRGSDTDVLQIMALQSGDPVRIRGALGGSLPPALLPQVILLLGRDDVAVSVFRALRRVAPRRIGTLVDALLNPQLADVVAARVARVLGNCPSRAAMNGLALGVSDPRGSVRRECARTLAKARRRWPNLMP